MNEYAANVWAKGVQLSELRRGHLRHLNAVAALVAVPARLPLSLNKEQVPFVRNTLEAMHAPVGEAQSGAGDQVSDGA